MTATTTEASTVTLPDTSADMLESVGNEIIASSGEKQAKKIRGSDGSLKYRPSAWTMGGRVD